MAGLVPADGRRGRLKRKKLEQSSHEPVFINEFDFTLRGGLYGSGSLKFFQSVKSLISSLCAKIEVYCVFDNSGNLAMLPKRSLVLL